MNIPMTLSCICSLFEKQIVFRLKRFICVLKFRFFRSFSKYCLSLLDVSMPGYIANKNPNRQYDSEILETIEVRAKALVVRSCNNIS